MNDLVFRQAIVVDLPTICDLLMDDMLSAQRDWKSNLADYESAFSEIQQYLAKV